MADNETNATMQKYDYNDYYTSEPGNFTPCVIGDMVEFARVFVTVLYSLVFAFGFIGNGLVVCVLVKHRHQTNLTDICLFNLALSDLLFILMLPLYSHYTMVKEWTLGAFMCHFTGGSNSTGFFSSIFFMVVMTLDRYLVIMHSHKMAPYRTVRCGVALTVIVWVSSLCVSLPMFVFTTVTDDDDRLGCDYVPENDAWRVYKLFTTNILGLVIPLLVMFFCYSRIIPVLVRMKTEKKHRVVKLIICVVVLFFILWAPYNISLFLEFLHLQGSLSSCTFFSNLRLSITATEALAYTHCCLNPLVYAFVGQKFMRRVVQLLRKCLPRIYRPSRELSDSSFKRSSVMSRSSDATFIM